MANKKSKIRVSFENPNTKTEFEKMLKIIIIDKIMLNARK